MEHKKDSTNIPEVFTRAERQSSETTYNKSAVTDHAARTNHVIDWEGAEIVDREEDQRTRQVKEAIWIARSAIEDIYDHSSGSPYFIPQPNNVTFKVGQTATLQCSVENLGDKYITWRKSSQPHHISIGELIFAPDKRFNVSISLERREYDLKIQNVQPKDAGVYICQVSSMLKLIRHVRLRVVGQANLPTRSDLTNTQKHDTTHLPPYKMPEIQLTGRQFVNSGETVRLICNVTGITDVPHLLVWFKDGYRLKPSNDDKLSIYTDSSIANRKLNSVLEIRNSKLEDSGMYVCYNTETLLASQKVLVLQDEVSKPDKRGTAGHATSGQLCNKQWWTLFLATLLYLCITRNLFQHR